MSIIKVEKRAKTTTGYEDIIYQKTSADIVMTNSGSNVETELANKAPLAHTHPSATTSVTGLMSATDKSKLDGIATGANNYVHPDTTSIRHVTDAEKATWNAKETTTGSQSKADTALASAKSYADTKVASLVSSAPETLDTLKELADALGNDANFATTIATQIGTKVDKVSGMGLSTNDYTTTEKSKLAGLSNYSLPTASSTTLGGVKIGSGITISSGVISVPSATIVTWPTLSGKPSTFPPSTHTHTSVSSIEPTGGEETWYKIL